MSTRILGRITCPICDKKVCSDTGTGEPGTGRLYTHGPVGGRCWASRKTGPQVHTYLLRQYWRIGDALAASRLTGISYTAPNFAHCLDLDDELRLAVEHARVFIAAAYHRLYEVVNA